jgi:hypothetical protein
VVCVVSGALYRGPGSPSTATTTIPAVTASQARDEHVDDGDDATDDGVADGADRVDDAHEACADGVEDALDLFVVSMVQVEEGKVQRDVRKRRRHPY